MGVDVSFVLVAYNEAAHIETTVRSVLAQKDLDDFEVLVVDDGSTDATPEIVARMCETDPRVRLVSHGRNRGRGAARATGVDQSRGRIIAMGDGDVIFPPHWLATCAKYLESFDAVGGTAVPDGDVSYLHRRAGLLPRTRQARCVVPGSNGAFRSEVLRSVTYDPTLSDGEDIAINHALQAAGYRLLNIPGLTVEHWEDKDFCAAVAWMFTSGKGATRQLARYRAVRVPDLCAAGWVVFTALAARQWRRPARAVAVLAGYPATVALAHVAQRFEIDYRRPWRFVFAVALDTVMLSVYFAGRLWGVKALVGAGGSGGQPK